MRAFISTIAVLSAILLEAKAAVLCPAVCRTVKPVCPPGQHPTGSEGCWGCCVPGPVVTFKPLPSATTGPIESRQDDICLAVCIPEKPVCPYGEAPTGAEGCWGCCRPIKPTATPAPVEPRQDVCAAVCRPDKPVCPYGEAPTGSEGCWGCCVKVTTPVKRVVPTPSLHPCTKICRFEKPVCPVGEAPTGGEGCWGCCQPIY